MAVKQYLIRDLRVTDLITQQGLCTFLTTLIKGIFNNKHRKVSKRIFNNLPENIIK
jgi:hypothetical protein